MLLDLLLALADVIQRIDWDRLGELVLSALTGVVAIVALWLATREREAERSAAYRSSLYARRLEAYLDLAEVAGQVHFYWLRVLSVAEQDRKEAFRAEADNRWDQLLQCQGKYLPIIDRAVADRISDYLLAALQLAQVDPANIRPEPFKDANRALQIAIREAIGTDPLARRTFDDIASLERAAASRR